MHGLRRRSAREEETKCLENRANQGDPHSRLFDFYYLYTQRPCVIFLNQYNVITVAYALNTTSTHR